jgi:hypothetical protein
MIGKHAVTPTWGDGVFAETCVVSLRLVRGWMNGHSAVR